MARSFTSSSLSRCKIEEGNLSPSKEINTKMCECKMSRPRLHMEICGTKSICNALYSLKSVRNYCIIFWVSFEFSFLYIYKLVSWDCQSFRNLGELVWLFILASAESVTAKSNLFYQEGFLEVLPYLYNV